MMMMTTTTAAAVVAMVLLDLLHPNALSMQCNIYSHILIHTIARDANMLFVDASEKEAFIRWQHTHTHESKQQLFSFFGCCICCVALMDIKQNTLAHIHPHSGAQAQVWELSRWSVELLKIIPVKMKILVQAWNTLLINDHLDLF